MLTDLLKRLAQTCGYRVRRLENVQFFDFEALLYFALSRTETFRFAQVGACDGVRFDPIYEFVSRNQRRVRGVVIEPLPDLFERLQANYRSIPSVTPVNVAIHQELREAPIYRVAPQRLAEAPEWAVGISSFDPHHHRRSGIPSEWIVAETVRCQPLEEIVREHSLTPLDLLQIDTEGYDATLLLGLNFAEVRPRIIRFEHGLQSGTMDRATFDRVVAHLHAQGYELQFETSDAVACQRDFLLESL